MLHSSVSRRMELAANGFDPGPVNAVLHVPAHKVPDLSIADKVLGDQWDEDFVLANYWPLAGGWL